MKTKKQYKKHNKLTKSKRVNKANKKIGGAESDYWRTFNGIKFKKEEEEAYYQAVLDDKYDNEIWKNEGKVKKNKPENNDTNKPAEDKPAEDEAKVPKKKWMKPFIMGSVGIALGIAVLVTNSDKL